MECGACALNCPVQAIEVQSGVGCAWAMISAALRERTWTAVSAVVGEIPVPVVVNRKRDHPAIVNAEIRIHRGKMVKILKFPGSTMVMIQRIAYFFR